MSRQTETFTLENYGKESTFASFLPGIAGVKGIPIWCYYVNRGQGVVSFGVDNKDHAIMEFYPAHMAYQNVKRTGFRTFLRRDGAYVESFSDENRPHRMEIGMNRLEISEELPEQQLAVTVSYFTLPEEPVGALVRRLTVKNTGDSPARIELCDGMPALIPYGVGIDSMKNMTQTGKAWMQVEDSATGVPYYRVRASMGDTAAVSIVEGGNFALGIDGEGERLPVVVDPEALFAYDNSLEKPVTFMEGGISAVRAEEENYSNLLPCCFFLKEKTLAAGESMTLFEVIGQVESKEILTGFLKNSLTADYFEQKEARAIALVEDLVAGITTRTGNGRFDAYCKYTYMDNILRGGFPIPLGHNKIFYVYSRKHGDLERDYNYFSMLPEFYSQGNGNFRDVNQNRRLDTFFSPFVGRENIHTFYSLVQLDGYNPLGVEKLTYTVAEDKARLILKELDAEKRQKLMALVTGQFTPGRLYAALTGAVGEKKAEKLFDSMIDFAESLVNGNFGEGYWSDHWDYNLDLIEEYLSVFPEEEEEMLYEQAYSFFLSQVNINHRFRRYEKTANGIRQYHALNEATKRSTKEKLVRADFGEGEIIRTTLVEKLLLLCATKFAALDPYGMGIEMEGGKPGWYDALNGMPGMLGSSVAEACELARMLEYTIGALRRYPREIKLLTELGSFISELELINRLENENLFGKDQVISFWNKINDAKEIYRDKTYQGVSGKRTSYTAEELARMLEGCLDVVNHGLEKAAGYGQGIIPTYFTYEVTDYRETEEGIVPLDFEVRSVPCFLEGPVRYLKLPLEAKTKKDLYENVKNSDLYDEKLSMYKVNASLQEASYELGRARAFTPGWLENESIWLHMEYKYLLELLKSGMYPEFAEDFHKAVIPFLDEKVYGRSTLENSSFIASSKNPNKKIHGKGFVARLSGSTVEFLHMWKIMMFGKTPFVCGEDGLKLVLAPAVPEYLIAEDGTVTAMLLSGVEVTYRFAERRDYFPGSYGITGMEITRGDGTAAQINGGEVPSPLAEEIREGRIKSICVNVK
ncbi:MAG: hypothetical protein NC180_01455 [Muribaculaceae bacterium]|nr:hypothetical protein [Roseburia sp.]MCM1430614.1 hypothetical protein [Muribaculaceae bacterium]MCM1491881.1 hypothetical protein [Muribaculaceae bacterium]